MASSSVHHSSSSRYASARFARNAAFVSCIALLLSLAYVLVTRTNGKDLDEGGNARLTSGTPSSNDGDNNAQVKIHWDENPPSHRDSTAGTSTPVKGGVEVYPLQVWESHDTLRGIANADDYSTYSEFEPARRPRHVNVPLVPGVEMIEDVDTTWKFPDVYDRKGSQALRGLYVMFHGCHHGPLDWFDLPEERTIVSFLVKHEYAVVAPASADRTTGCWSVGGGKDIPAVKNMLWKFYKDWSIAPSTPLFLFGASSGGVMATALGREGRFTLCDKRTTLISVSGILTQVSWGVKPEQFGKGCPPLAFMPMPKKLQGDDGRTAVPADTPPVFGNTGKVPLQMTAIAHNIRRSGGRPRMLLLPLGEISLYPTFFSDRIYELTSRDSEELYDVLMSGNLLRCQEQMPAAELKCFLSEDPRRNLQALGSLTSAYEGMLSRPAESGAPDVLAPEMSAMASKGVVAGNNRGLREARGNMTVDHAREAFRELLNVAWGAHELSGEFVGLWESWLWKSCDISCKEWYQKKR